VVAGIKEIEGAPVGDTGACQSARRAKRCPGFKRSSRRSSPGFSRVVRRLRGFSRGPGKLTLNDASLFYEPETSEALGFGFRCGFLGMLHMEIIQERLEREYDLDLITTAPTVVYEVVKKNGETSSRRQPHRRCRTLAISTRCASPSRAAISSCPRICSGNVITLCVEKRGEQRDMQFLGVAGIPDLRHADGRGGAGFLRSAEVREPRLRVSLDYAFEALRGGEPGASWTC
jgi:GTP-binding protein LepA